MFVKGGARAAGEKLSLTEPCLVFMMQQFIQMILDYKILDSHQLKPFNICCGVPGCRQGRAALPVMTAVTRLRDFVTVSLSGRVTGSGRAVTAQSQPWAGRGPGLSCELAGAHRPGPVSQSRSIFRALTKAPSLSVSRIVTRSTC